MGRDKGKPHHPSTREGMGKNPLDASTVPGGKAAADTPGATDNRRAGADAAHRQNAGVRGDRAAVAGAPPKIRRPDPER